MPAPVPADTRKLLTVLFWGGTALAPVAALILLVADGNGPLRFAAVLAILAVVLIGLSIALRPDGGGPPAEEIRDEVQQLRRELRGEIVAAAQRGNQALDEVHRVQEALAGLRRQVDSGDLGAAGNEQPAAPGRARVPAPEAPSRPTAQAGVHGTARPAHGRAGGYDEERAGADGYGGERPGPAGYGGARSGPGNNGTASGSAGVYGPPVRPEQDKRPGDSGPKPLGMVRHTETVQVTTRHTIVNGGVGESGGRYGGYPAGWSAAQHGERGRGHATDRDEHVWSDGDDGSRRDENRRWSGPEHHDGRSWPGAAHEESAWSGPPHDDERSWSGSPREEERSWSPPQEDGRWSAAGDDWSAARVGGSDYPEGNSGDRDGRDQRSRDDRNWDAGAQRWESPAGPAPAPQGNRSDDTGAYWAQLRAGDRWAAVRDDDRGRELRVGERRAEVHADPAGTEYRVQDRWASVRRDDSRRDAAGEGAWHDGWSEPESHPALPAGGVPVPQEWQPSRERGYQPEPARGHQPEPTRGYAPEPGYGHRPGYPRAERPGGEAYGRRHREEESGYGPAGHDAADRRWR
ncbi:hypothetical protein [Micromonospora sp. HNM0581]|uniref:hypothetical protein n=1 Tax=Micromonospora sp. HNM0581 TaxID=2716341 RepID=UPI00197C050F|nr:hypothetical protein [Micromonospora sp. HNM0581]